MNVLVVDDEIEIVEIIEFLVKAKFPDDTEIYLAYSAITAIDILKNNKIDLCISDHNMFNGNGDEIFKYIMINKLAVKFVLCSSITPCQMPEIYPLDVIYHHIEKPDIVEGVNILAEKLKSSLPLNSNAEVLVLKERYIAVRLDFLLLLEKTPTDIYIRISENKYLKCLNTNEIFTIEDNDKYLSKDIAYLYVQVPLNHDYMNKLIFNALNKVMAIKNIPLNEKMIISHSQLTQLINFSGMSEELASVTKENIEQSISIIMENQLLENFWKKLNLMGEYPSKLYSLHAMLASVIAKKLKWSTKSTMFKLTLAAFLQDITLSTLKVMKIYDYLNFLEIEFSLSSEEIKNFLEHPMKAKLLINSFKSIPPDIDKIILEQHEMPDGSGFPRNLNSNQIGPLSCLFILSGILAKNVIEEGEKFQIKNFIEKFEPLGYSNGNFKDSFKVIKNM